MKKILTLILAFSLIFTALCAPALATDTFLLEKFTAGDFIYAKLPAAGKAAIAGYVNPASATGTLTIPATVSSGGTTYTVTEVGDYAFRTLGGITAVSFPAGITTIGEYAFADCDGITALTLPTGLTTIGESAFDGCEKIANALTLPAGVSYIGPFAFSGCEKIADNLTIPAAVTTIGRFAFDDCKLIKKITFAGATPPITVGAEIFNYAEFIYVDNIATFTTALGGKVGAAQIVLKTPGVAATPVITSQPATSISLSTGSTLSLSVTATASDGGTLSYQWFIVSSAVTTGGSLLSNSSTYSVQANSIGTYYYYCKVTNTKNGATASAVTTSIKVEVTKPSGSGGNGGSGGGGGTVATTPFITKQPVGSDSINPGDKFSMSIEANSTDGGIISYQWYVNTSPTSVGGTPIAGATGPEYSPPTDKEGTLYYYCVVTNTNGSATSGPTATAVSNICTVIVGDGDGDGGDDEPTDGIEIDGKLYFDVLGHWAKDSIIYVIENGLMNGVAEGYFAPDGKLSRAMLVTILYRRENSPAVSGNTPFTDLQKDSWYDDAVLWAYNNKIINGTSENTFSPDDNITREQIATIIYNYAKENSLLGSGAADKKLSDFSDGDKVSGYAAEAMTWAINAGLISGRDDGTLDPKNTATRGEMAAILQRFFK